MYVRFVTTRQDPDTGVQMGIFQTGELMPPTGLVADWDEARLKALEDWFKTHLRKPERFARSRSTACRR